MSDNKDDQINDLFTPLSEEEWLKFIQDGKFDDGQVLEEYRGAGEHVKVVFDDDSKIILSRILKKGGRVTFDDLVNEYGGYREYYVRESILLAKRVYRYLNDLSNRDRKKNVSTTNFTPPNEAQEIGWLDIIYEKEVSENQQFWSVRKELENVLKAKATEEKDWIDPKFYIGHNSFTNKYTALFISDRLKDKGTPSKFALQKLKNENGEEVGEHIDYFCRTTQAAARPDSIYPNYFYTEDGNSFGLTGFLGNAEKKYDVFNGNAKDILSKIKEKLDVKLLTKCSHGNTYQQYIPVQDGGFYGENSVHYEIIVKENRTDRYKRFNNAIYVELHIEHRAKITKERKKKLVNVLNSHNQSFFIRQNWGFSDGLLIRLKDKEAIIKNNDGTDKNFDDILNDVKDRLEELYSNTVHILKGFFGDNMSYDITKIKNLLITRKQLILNGAPGTGKTYTAKEIAACIVADGHDAVGIDGEQTDEEGESGETTDDNSKITDVNNTAASQVESEDDLDKVKTANPDNHDTEDTVAGQVGNNSNPSDSPDENQPSSRYKSLKDSEKKRIKIVQFHPGYDYSDFIIGLKPVLIQDDKTIYTEPIPQPEYDKNDTRKLKEEVTLAYAWQNGVFKEFAEKAAENKKEKGVEADNFVFIIDEINRADLSNVFGEAFSRLEADYRGEDVILPSGHRFQIPENLYIIGTMNDIDRSVESMDFALRRRFAWHEITADDSKIIIDSRVKNQSIATALKIAMKAINSVIAGTPADQIDSEIPVGHNIPEGVKELMNSGDLKNLGLGTEYKLGGAYFAPDIENINSDDTDQIDKIRDNLWNHHIKVILNDYLRGNKNKGVIINKFEDIYEKAFNEGFNTAKESSPASGAERAIPDEPEPETDEAVKK